MGRAKKKTPQRLGEKLKAIRDSFNFSFTQMANALSDEEIIVLRTDVNRFEKENREPSALILLRYARLMKVSVESLIDDNLELDHK